MNNFDVPLIDCDIHPFTSPAFPLEPHIPEKMRTAVEQGQASMPGHGYANPFGVIRRDMPAKDPDVWARELLDRYGIVYGVLQPAGLSISLTHNIDVGTALARAWNDWQMATWLAHDARWLGSICVNMNDPQQAAAEIRRAGQHPQMVQVIVCGESTHLYGHRSYDPIYEACAELGLPFAMHPGPEGSRTPSTPVGMPSSYLEWHTTIPLTFMAHCASLICEGVFEKFPQLKVVLVEGGFGWLPHLMWRLDKDFKALRSTTPWLKKLPSEYIVEHIRLTTQPIEEPETQSQLLQLFDMMHAERTLCFASDFPHWDFDDPRRVFPTRMDKNLKERIFYRNAAELYGLPSLEETCAQRAAPEAIAA
jgi:predicted TIM-barrel fold metal-dependent hydrolase